MRKRLVSLFKSPYIFCALISLLVISSCHQQQIPGGGTQKQMLPGGGPGTATGIEGYREFIEVAYHFVPSNWPKIAGFIDGRAFSSILVRKKHDPSGPITSAAEYFLTESPNLDELDKLIPVNVIAEGNTQVKMYATREHSFPFSVNDPSISGQRIPMEVCIQPNKWSAMLEADIVQGQLYLSFSFDDPTLGQTSFPFTMANIERAYDEHGRPMLVYCVGRTKDEQSLPKDKPAACLAVGEDGRCGYHAWNALSPVDDEGPAIRRFTAFSNLFNFFPK